MYRALCLGLGLATTLASFAREGVAQGLNVAQLDHEDPSAANYMDIWGYEKDGTEVAIICDTGGTYFMNATDPTNTTLLTYVPGPSSPWRDVKTYGDYAYIVSESGGSIQVVSLVTPELPTLVGTAGTGQFQTAHNAWVDVPAGLLFVVGCDYLTLGRTDTHVYDVATNPAAPLYVYTFDDYYVHDMYSRDGIAYLASVYAGVLVTADLTQLPAAMPVLDTINSDDSFTHNVWLTEDGQHAITTDEVNSGHLTIFDVSDPTDLRYVSSYHHPNDPASIVHNVFVRGDIAYVSWYKAGFEAIYVGDPSNLARIGYYDTFPGSGGGFDGAWGCYPFASSGAVYVSDMASGLYVLELETANFGFIKGTVTSVGTGQPLPDATVTLSPAAPRPAAGARGGTIQVDANQDGFFSAVVTPGSYEVTYDAPLHESVVTNVVVPEGGTFVADAALAQNASAGSIIGTVIEVLTGDPVPNALVSLPERSLSALTDAQGAYAFTALPPGTYLLTTDAHGFCSDSRTAEIESGAESIAHVVLHPALLADDFEVASGWSVGAVGDDAVTGMWERVDPRGTGNGLVQPEDDHTMDPAALCFITEQAQPGGGIGDGDVDGGRTTLLSPIFDLSGAEDVLVTYYRWYYTDEQGTPDDIFEAYVSDDGGETFVLLREETSSDPSWARIEIALDTFVTPTATMQFAFVAGDLGTQNIVEAGVDDFQICARPTVAVEPVPVIAAVLLRASPNPFRAAVTIPIVLAEASHARVGVYDVAGRLVRRLADGRLEAGRTELTWDGRNGAGSRLAPGVYLYRLETAERSTTHKVVLAE